MKFTTWSKSLVLVSALLLAVSASAEKAKLQLSNPVLLNGTTLKPGDYKLEWEGTGPTVELSIKQGKNVVAKVSARVVGLDMPGANDAVLTKKNVSGPNSLSGIRFQGKKFALQLGEASEAMQTGSSQ
jgi:hypothetical protein